MSLALSIPMDLIKTLNKGKTRLDEEISQDYMRNRDYSWHLATNSEHYQTSRSHQHSTGKNQDNYIISKQQLQNTNGKRYI